MIKRCHNIAPCYNAVVWIYKIMLHYVQGKIMRSYISSATRGIDMAAALNH